VASGARARSRRQREGLQRPRGCRPGPGTRPRCVVAVEPDAGVGGPGGGDGVPAGMGVRPRRGPGWQRAFPPRCRQRCDLRGWLVGLPGLEPGTSSLSGFCTGAHFPRIAWMTCANDVPLTTAGDRWRVAQTWTRHAPLAGAAALRVADLAWQGRPPPAAPDKRTRPATALLGGALGGSGPGTSPCIDGLSLASGMVVPQRSARSNHGHDGGCLGLRAARLPEGVTAMVTT
jgi:hypothetical protein